MPAREPALVEYVPDRVWLATYPVRYAGCRFLSRTTIVRLANGELWVHSPCPCGEPLARQVDEIGPVAHIVAPGTYHYLHVAAWQVRYPKAVTWICPGVERKRPRLAFDWLLGDRAPEAWHGQLDQVLVRGNRIVWEVAFLHRESRTLILTDLVENIGDGTEGTDLMLRLWWKVLRMWNRAKPAPEYQMGWRDRAAARASLERILAWDFHRAILAHGDLIEHAARETVRTAWARPLSFAAA